MRQVHSQGENVYEVLVNAGQGEVHDVPSSETVVQHRSCLRRSEEASPD
jgi:hypothetical protein